MKKISAIFCLVLSIAIQGCADILSGNSEHEKDLFKKIHLGMNVEHVNKILGKPENVYFDSTTKESYYYYFTKNKSGMRSEIPTIIFDSSRKVIFSTYGY